MSGSATPLSSQNLGAPSSGVPADAPQTATSGAPVSAASGSPRPSALRRFMGYAWPYGWLFGLASLAGMMKFILPATMALSLRFLTDRLVSGAAPAGESGDFVSRAFDRYLAYVGAQFPGEHSQWWTFNVLMVTLAGIYVLWGVSFYFRSYWAQLAGHRVILDLRTDLYQHITRLSHRFFQEHQSGSIVSRLVGDVALAQNFLGSAMTNIWMDLASCVFYLHVLFSLDASLAAASLCVFPLYIASMRLYGRKAKETSHEVQEALESFTGSAQERISGQALVKTFTAERREVRSFFGIGRRLFDLTLTNVRTTTAANALVQWLTQMATLGIIWYGGYRLIQGQTSVGTVVAFVLLLRELYFPVNRISEMNTVLHTSLAAIERIFELFDLTPDVREDPRAVAPGRLEGRITLDHVTFGYERDRPVLRDVSLDIRPGEVVALVGPSGAGKSSLVQLLSRFFDPQGGRVLVDGKELRSLQLRPFRAQVGVVAQDTVLFSGTVRENLLYARPKATDAELFAAARAAHAHDFIQGLAQGYDTLIGERGAKLSGGQRQRLALARVFLADPRILVLDEATSALDSESERLIQESLAELMKGRTSVVIAHRLSTVLHADRIVVLDQGRVVEVGRHAELVARGGLYARLYRTQLLGGHAG